jgi:hypothetical protein
LHESYALGIPHDIRRAMIRNDCDTLPGWVGVPSSPQPTALMLARAAFVAQPAAGIEAFVYKEEIRLENKAKQKSRSDQQQKAYPKSSPNTRPHCSRPQTQENSETN